MEDGVPIEHKMVTKAIARAQKQVEAQNFSMRKHLLEYDDVMNKQRENVYTLRRQLLESKIQLEDEPEPVDTQGYLMTVAEDVVANTVDEYCPPDGDRERLGRRRAEGARRGRLRPRRRACSRSVDEPGLRNEAVADTRVDQRHRGLPREGGDGRQGAVPRPGRRPAAARARGAPRRDHDGAERAAARRSPAAPSWSRSRAASCCRSSTQQWKDHLYSLDHLKEGIGLRGYGQRDPLVEYKKESFTLFQAMKGRIDEEMVRYLWRLRPVIDDRRRRRPGGARVAPQAPAGARGRRS